MKQESTKVFITSKEATCDECKQELGTHGMITVGEGGRALCLSCSDLDRLVFLPSGDAALTRRSKAHSRLSAVVLKWSRARKRYERQGLLVEQEALERAERECLADAEVRTRRKEREEKKRVELDQQYVDKFAARIRELFPSCPAGRERVIAEHACMKYSGRVGRSSDAKRLDEEAVTLATVAHIRHTETNYDELLQVCRHKRAARLKIQAAVQDKLTEWRQPR